MNEEDFSSDSSDEDYVPQECGNVSEEEDSGDDEGTQGEIDRDTCVDTTSGRKTRAGVTTNKKKNTPLKSRKGAGGELAHDEVSESGEVVSGEKEKKRVDDLWADFLKDTTHARPAAARQDVSSSSSTAVAPSSTSTTNTKTVTTSSSSSALNADKSLTDSSKVVIVKEYKFAGETVKVETSVDAKSKQAQAHNAESSSTLTSNPTSMKSIALGMKRPGGLSSVLNKIDKRPKMSTLVKSKLDWETFKSNEGIDEELKTHNRGKGGYLERQAFLQRTDERQFEIERTLRLSSANKKT